MPLKQIAAPADFLSLVETKEHLRVTWATEDALIGALISSACQWIESWLGRALMPQQWELHLDAFPDGDIKLPFAPLKQIDSVKYKDANGTLQTLDSAEYSVDSISEPCWVLQGENGWPETGEYASAVQVRFQAGYADAAAVPAPVKLAAKLIVGHFFANREDSISGTIIAKLPMGVDALLSPYRIMEF